jgi:hypothetical protein
MSVGRVGMVTPSGRCKFRRGVVRATIPTNNNIVPSFFTRQALLYSDRSTGRFWAATTKAKRCHRRPQARPLRQLKLQPPAPLRPPEFLLGDYATLEVEQDKFDQKITHCRNSKRHSEGNGHVPSKLAPSHDRSSFQGCGDYSGRDLRFIEPRQLIANEQGRSSAIFWIADDNITGLHFIFHHLTANL